MKKLCLLVVFALSFNAFAVDLGAVLSFGTDFKFDGNEYSSPKLEQTETLTPYIKVPIGDTMYFAAEASIQHKLTAQLGENSSTKNEAILDLTLLKFNKIWKFAKADSLTLSLGRMFVMDSTGLVFAQPNDGLFLKYAAPKVEFGAYAGYSGLQNIKNVQILSSGGDVFSLENEHILYDCAAPYITATASISAPYLFAAQTLSFEAMAFIKTQGITKLPDDELNRFYATLMLGGPMANSLFYDISVTAETFDFKQAALLGKFGMTYFAPFKNATVAFNAVYASGNNGGLVPFVGFTKMVACSSAQEPFYSGIMKFGVSGSIVPVKPLYIGLGVNCVFDMMQAAEQNAAYYGTEIAAMLKYQPFSDLQFTFGASTFIAKESANNRTELKLTGALAF